MLLIDCPWCGERPEPEFVYGGQAHYLYLRENSRGVHAERWRHTHGCGRFFNALRDTTSDQFLATYKVGEAPPSPGQVSR